METTVGGGLAKTHALIPARSGRVITVNSRTCRTNSICEPLYRSYPCFIIVICVIITYAFVNCWNNHGQAIVKMMIFFTKKLVVYLRSTLVRIFYTRRLINNRNSKIILVPKCKLKLGAFSITTKRFCS